MAEVDRMTGVVAEQRTVMVRRVVCAFCGRSGPEVVNSPPDHAGTEASAAGFLSFAPVGEDDRKVWLCGRCVGVVGKEL